MIESITFAVLFALGKVQGPVEQGATDAANKRGFLVSGRPSPNLKLGLALLADEAYLAGRELTDLEIIEDVTRTVEVTLDWQRFDAGETAARISSALGSW